MVSLATAANVAAVGGRTASFLTVIVIFISSWSVQTIRYLPGFLSLRLNV